MDFSRAVVSLCCCSLCVLSSLVFVCLSSRLCLSVSLPRCLHLPLLIKLHLLNFPSSPLIHVFFHFIASVHRVPSFFPSALSFVFSVVKIKWKWVSSVEILRHQVNELFFSIKIKKHLFSWPAGHEDTSKLFCTSEYVFIMVMCLISPSHSVNARLVPTLAVQICH